MQMVSGNEPNRRSVSDGVNEVPDDASNSLRNNNNIMSLPVLCCVLWVKYKTVENLWFHNLRSSAWSADEEAP